MRTSLLAASIWIAACGWAAEQQLTTEETAQWKRVEPSVVMVYQGSVLRGAAALIDADGWFLAHQSVVTGPVVRARLSNGKMIFLKPRAVDGPTQLVLLQADKWERSMGKPVKTASNPVKPGDLLFAVIPSGVIRAQFVSGDRLGVVAPSNRVIPLGEIKFEATLDKIGGALIFSKNGELVGAMKATLASPGTNYQNALAGRAGGGAFGNGGGARGGAGMGGAGGGDDMGARTKGVTGMAEGLSLKQGPAEMTVAYIVGQDALNRVVDAFRSPSHEVTHPTLGIVCREAGGAGALIVVVQPDSQAEKAGIKPNDILEELAGIPIHNQVEFAKAMLKQEVGKTIQIRVKRDGRSITLSVVVGKGQTRLVTPNP